MSSRPVKIAASPEYLKRFRTPLWELLMLDGCKPMTIVVGSQDGWRFTVIEMEHRGVGSPSDRNHTGITTFFIIERKDKLQHPRITWRPEGYQASVDDACVYMAYTGRKERIADWRYQISQASGIAESLEISSEPTQAQGRARSKTYVPEGPGALKSALIAIVLVLLGAMFTFAGFAQVLGMRHFLCSPDCDSFDTFFDWSDPRDAGIEYFAWGIGFFFASHHFFRRMQLLLEN